MRRVELRGVRVALLAMIGIVLDPASSTSARGQEGPGAGAKSRQATAWPGMTSAGTVLLPNGWSLKPAGRQTRLGDLPVQIAVHPSDPILAVLHAGYGEHEVVTVDAETGRVIGRVAMPETFAG